ncbi:hypothetical protein F9B85_08790 [Heliorestis acidaminivorans]|uniref:Uncharacterized protein n=1 Tax=Heliorestis acidaminivorans TaxID=553427 RepID=A0A6I0ER61_9FIRM|nr:hypothetical protein F9B85_08790 [Heliorestis acidaminivorans]
MNWNEIFDADHIPSIEDIREYLGEAKSIWDELTAYLISKKLTRPNLISLTANALHNQDGM